MPSLSQHQSNNVVKVLLIGDAKSGKTGSLVSLVAAGYKLRILDFDNLLDILKYMILEQCPDKIDNVEFRSLRDKTKATAMGHMVDGQAKAFPDAIKMIDLWKYTTDDGEIIDLGKPSEWGPDCILVIDSLSRLCDAAWDFREPLVPHGKGGNYDIRALYKDAQDAVESVLAHITSPRFNTNVIVIAHGSYMVQPDKSYKIFPQGVGQALSPKIPQYFPNYIRYKNLNEKRSIQLNSDAMIDLANTNPSAFAGKTLPIETGLATLFAALKNPVKPSAQAQPVSIVKRA